ncbi:SRPBCC family protein [Methylobacterium sp. WL30]|uniref:SRPBCC family protein n=1 Tax=unclassified Methylobacterium TaxID=2615210 RepID=UPI0011C7D20F|nr:MULTISPECIES: SRPBCC family protein [unclassified Methylobacterium]TXN40602.1 SRPBCC family protein [Methylobacterium sp. WL93]TXN51540.1 SRPBCC family protein [Methylobacterium sp. WL119]TXN63544.1 SRPBCC family protein [Methylobacterium sp. WL30]
MFKSAIPAVALAVVAGTPAFALEVTKTTMIAASPDAVWKTIGGFCGIGNWHPVIETCALSKNGGKEQRTLHLKGGGLLVEQEQDRDDKKMAYTYTILSGPLPVEDYRSTIMVEKEGSGSIVTWTGSFKAKGAPDDKAKDAIAGVYDAGLKGIAAKAK